MKSKFLLTVLLVVGFSIMVQATPIDCPPTPPTQHSTSPVPDGGTTAMLLGGALAGLGLFKRKFLACHN